MPEAARTYWLTTPCRIRRQDQSLRIEREGGGVVHIPVTDVRDIVACAPVDVNTAVISLLNRHRISVHFLSYYGDYAGSLLTADPATAGAVVLGQARLAADDKARVQVAREIVRACAFNVRRVVDRKLLARPLAVLEEAVPGADTCEELMGIEGNFRRTAWEVLDTHLPEWLRLGGRSRRPPRNAGNAFISYVNGIVYSRLLTAVRLTPLHSGIAFLHSALEHVIIGHLENTPRGIAFLHSALERQRHALVLDLAEVFRPLFSERLLLRLSGRGKLKPQHFDTDVNQAMLSESGRKLVVQAVRDELAVTVQHRRLGRPVAYEELLYLEALKLTRTCLEGEPYVPFRIWW